MPEISLIVRTFNEERHLPALLDAVSKQTAAAQVVVVDSGSFDRTPEIAQDHGARLVQIRSSDFTFGYSLNRGIRDSRGRYIAIVSAHTLPVHDRWLERLMEPFQHEGVAMTYGRQCGTPTSKYAELQDFRRTFGAEPEVMSPPNFFANNANSAVRRALWDEYPFDETLPGLEDIDWAKYWMERGLEVVYEPDAAIYHIHEESWRQVRRRYYREGVAAKWIGLKTRRDIPAEVVRESWRLVADLGRAARERALTSRSREIVRFRLQKTRGTVSGLWDGTAMGDPRQREAAFDTVGRAVVIRERGAASLEQIEIPEVKPGDVLIRVAYVGVCATDLEILDGSLGYYKSGQAKYPIIPGHEFSGTVMKVGPNVNGLARGDRVVVECIQTCGKCERCTAGYYIACDERREVGVIGQDGAYADYVVVPGMFVHVLPSGVDLRRGALVEPLAVVLKGLRRLNRIIGTEPRRVAVVGAGPIGHLAALVLASRGNEVLAIDQRADRLDALRAADESIRVSQDMTELAAMDGIVEATGSVEALDAVIHDSAPGAALLLLGLPYGLRSYTFEEVVAYDKVVVGSVGSTKQDFQIAAELLAVLNVEQLLQYSQPLEQYEEVWNEARTGDHLKILFEVNASAR